jgi:hypothetical protein
LVFWLWVVHVVFLLDLDQVVWVDLGSVIIWLVIIHILLIGVFVLFLRILIYHKVLNWVLWDNLMANLFLATATVGDILHIFVRDVFFLLLLL